MKKLLFTISLFLLFTHAGSQNKKAVFYAVPQAVLLNGDGQVSGQALFSMGVERRKWSIGAGFGVDYYKLRTIPLFLQSRYMLTGRIFVYGNAGPSFAWPLETQRSTHYLTYGAVSVDEFSLGMNADAGLGYRIPVDKTAILISLGYSLKTVHQKYQEVIYQGTFPAFPETVNRKLDYTLNRVALRMAFPL